MRKLLCLATLLLCTGAALAASQPSPTVLPKPRFNVPAKASGKSRVQFVLVSSSPRDPAAELPTGPTHGPSTFEGAQLLLSSGPLSVYGADGTTARYVLAPGRYAFDFGNYAYSPRIVPADREFVYEQVEWAREDAGVLYVETAHSTYARSSLGLNAYVNAIDLKTRKLLWRSPALVANARNFVLAGDVIVSGYGFTAEPDYLYALDRRTGKVLARLLVPTGPERIVRHGSTLTVDTYDHHLVVVLRRER